MKADGNEHFGSELQRLRKNASLTIRQLELYSGVSNAYLSQLENGKRPRPTPSILRKLAKPLGIDYATLLRIAGYVNANELISEYLKVHSLDESDINPVDEDALTSKVNVDTERAPVMIPVLGTIKAGYDMLAYEKVIEYQPAPAGIVSDGSEYFYLMITGDSMIEEGIRPGMRVLVHKQNWVEDGKIGVIIINGDEATLKRVLNRDGEVVLISSNVNYSPRVFQTNDIHIVGQVKQVVWDV